MVTVALLFVDVKDMFQMPDGTSAQKGRLDSQAQKMVLEGEKQ